MALLSIALGLSLHRPQAEGAAHKFIDDINILLLIVLITDGFSLLPRRQRDRLLPFTDFSGIDRRDIDAELRFHGCFSTPQNFLAQKALIEKCVLRDYRADV